MSRWESRWACTPMTSVSGRLRREDFEFEVSRGHKARPCLRETPQWLRKSKCDSYRGPGFGSQHPCQSAHSHPQHQLQGANALCRPRGHTCAHVAFANRHTHINKHKIFEKKRKLKKPPGRQLFKIWSTSSSHQKGENHNHQRVSPAGIPWKEGHPGDN